MTISFQNLAIINKIALFQLFPYFIYLTQLLDIEVFQLLTYYYINTINKTIRLGDKKFGKLEFLAVFQSFCNQIFKFCTIWHASKSTNLVSFYFTVVFHKICQKQAQKQQTALQTLSLPSFLLNKRPLQTLVSVVKHKQKLQKVHTKLQPWEKIDSKQIQ